MRYLVIALIPFLVGCRSMAAGALCGASGGQPYVDAAGRDHCIKSAKRSSMDCRRHSDGQGFSCD